MGLFSAYGPQVDIRLFSHGYQVADLTCVEVGGIETYLMDRSPPRC